MGQTILVSPDIEIGREAIEALDEAGIKPSVALIAMFPEYSDWRFVIASSGLDQEKPLKAHTQVAKALRGDFVSRMPLTMVLPLKDPFIRELRKLFGKTKSVDGMRLGGQIIGNRFLDNAYVYRIK